MIGKPKYNYNDEVKSEQNLSELLMTKIEKQKSNSKPQ